MDESQPICLTEFYRMCCYIAGEYRFLSSVHWTATKLNLIHEGRKSGSWREILTCEIKL